MDDWLTMQGRETAAAMLAEPLASPEGSAGGDIIAGLQLDRICASLPAGALRVVREQIRSAPLKPMEDFSGRQLSPRDAQRQAEEVLRSGWVLSASPAVDLTLPIPWEQSVQRNRSWSFHLHSWDLVDVLLLAYSGSGHRRLLETCLRVATEWISRFSLDRVASVFAWYDMAVGMRATRLAFLIDAAARLDGVADGDLLVMLMSAERHRAYLADDGNFVYHNNHGFYQAAGQAALAKRLSFLPRMAEGYEQARHRLLTMLDQQFSKEHVHKEHSPDYHLMVLRALASLIQSGLLSDPEISERYRACERSLAWFVFPDGQIVNFGDSDTRNLTVAGAHAERVWQTDEMRWCASTGATGRPDQDEHRVFHASGYFVVRRRHDQDQPRHDSYLAMIAAYHSRTHKHADDLSLVWFERGQHILIDAGRYGYLEKTAPGGELWTAGFWYGHPARVYCESTHAHNTVEIDGTSFPRRSEKPYGSAIRHGGRVDDLFYCEAQVRHFKSVRHARTILYAPQRWLLVVDWLWDLAPSDHRFTQWWHLAEGSQLTQLEALSWRAEVPGLDRALYLAVLSPEEIEASLAEAQTEPRLQGWWSPSNEVLRPAPALGLGATKGLSKVAFATLFSLDVCPSQTKAHVTTSTRKLSATWRDECGTHSLRLTHPQGLEHPVEISYVRRDPAESPRPPAP